MFAQDDPRSQDPSRAHRLTALRTGLLLIVVCAMLALRVEALVRTLRRGEEAPSRALYAMLVAHFPDCMEAAHDRFGRN